MEQDRPVLLNKRPSTNMRKLITGGAGEDKEKKDSSFVEKPTKIQRNNPLGKRSNKIKDPYLAEEETSVSITKEINVELTAQQNEPDDTTLDGNPFGKRDVVKDEASLSGKYLGRNSYLQYLPHKDSNQGKSTFRAGPIRQSTTVRWNCRFDYAPDLCKDYNETGFCGFGDSCKFLHDRGDYKAGWELDAEWEAEQQRKLDEASRLADIEDDIVKVEKEETSKEPTSCGICDRDFTPPIVQTNCGHRFCETCALSHARISKRCKLCDAMINGQFKFVKNKAK